MSAWKWTFFILERYFCPNFWTNRVYNKKESSIFKRLFRYLLIIIKYCYVVYTSYVTKNLMNFYRVKVKIWDLTFEISETKKYKFGICQFIVKWKRSHFRSTCDAQKRLCLSSLLKTVWLSAVLNQLNPLLMTERTFRQPVCWSSSASKWVLNSQLIVLNLIRQYHRKIS